MRRILFIFAAVLLSSIGLHAGNTITYTASERLSGRNGSLNVGKTYFGPAITSHTFSNGTGTIICAGEITMIGNDAFQDCPGLTSITIPNSVTTIGEYSFYSCTSLKNVTIPNSVTEIGHSAFRYCGNLVSVTIGNSVRTFGDFAFGSDFSLTLVKVNWTDAQSIVPINEFIFVGIANEAGPKGARLVVPKGTSNLYRQANVWKEFGSIIEPDQVITYTASERLRPLNGYLEIGANTFGSPIKSHDFSKGTGIITCDGEITMIGSCAFVMCRSLTSITLPNSVIMIGDQSFNGCSSLTSMVIPNSVTTIREMAFRACTGLTTIVIPASVKQIEWGTFMDSPNLQSVYCYALTPPSRIGGTIFTHQPTVYTFNTGAYIESWSELPPSCFKPISAEVGGFKYEFFDGNKARVVAKEGGYTGNIVIPEQITYQGMNFAVTEIGSRAFYECKSMTSVTIPNSVTTIGEKAFYVCSGLTSITIPASVTSIGETAFEGSSTGLTSIVVAGDNPKYDSRDNCNAIIEKATNTLILGCKHTKIPNNITTIGRSAFDGCYDLKDITIPNSVTTIGRSAFWECKSLTSVTIPNSVTTIGINAFKGTGLTSITIPASVKEINDDAFWDCLNLEDLLFAERTEALNIGAYAFEKCPNLKYIISMVEAPPLLAEEVFKGHDKDDKVIVYVPSQDAVTMYKNSDWSKYFTNFITELEYRIISSADRTAEVIKAIPIDGKVYIPAVVTLDGNLYNVAGIGNDVFNYSDKDNEDLQSISLPPTMQYIGDRAFNRCVKLTQIELPVELQAIGASAFYGCSALDSIVIPEGVQSIGNGSFMECTGLTSISLPTGLKVIPNDCFRHCYNLRDELIIPEGVDTIGVYAFNTDTLLRKVYLPSTLKELRYGAFAGCALQEVICLAPTPPTLVGATFGAPQGSSLYVYVSNRDQIALYKNSLWDNQHYAGCYVIFKDLMAEANKEYLRELAGSNDTAKAIANAYCDSIDNRATTTQQVQDYTNTAAMMMDKYVFPEYKVRLCNELDNIAADVLNAQPIADDYKQRIMDTHFRGEAENLFAEGYAKIDALKQLYALKEKCGKALQDMGKEHQDALKMANIYAGLIDGAATQEEVYQLYEEGKKRVAQTLFLKKYWKYSDGCYYLGGFIEEK